jgi:hypothetical protein
MYCAFWIIQCKLKKSPQMTRLILLLLVFTSCAQIGGTVLYKSSLPIKLENLGYFNLLNEEAVKKNIPYGIFAFQDATEKTLKNLGCQQIKNVNEKLLLGLKQKDQIIELCKKYSLNGLLVTEILHKKIALTSNNQSPSPERTQFRVAEVKLYDNKGILVCHTRFESTWNELNPEDYIKKSVEGALKLMAKK